MGKLEFEEMLEQQEAIVDSDDAKKRLEDWKGEVNCFYQCVSFWLGSFKEKKQLTYQITKISIDEDFVKSYQVSAMQIRFGRNVVEVRPIGMNIIGAMGRIDMEGARGRVSFFLEEKGIETKLPTLSHWKILSRQSKGSNFESLTEEVFFDSLMEIVSV